MSMMSLYDIIQGERSVQNCTTSYWSVLLTQISHMHLLLFWLTVIGQERSQDLIQKPLQFSTGLSSLGGIIWLKQGYPLLFSELFICNRTWVSLCIKKYAKTLAVLTDHCPECHESWANDLFLKLENHLLEPCREVIISSAVLEKEIGCSLSRVTWVAIPMQSENPKDWYICWMAGKRVV